MFLIILSSIIIISTLIGLGKMMENSIGSICDGISGNILTGILGLSLIWLIISFFVPLNIYVEIITIMIGTFYFFKKKVYRETYAIFKKNTFSIISICLIVLFSGSYYPFILDHFGYYVPTIKWLTEYGIIKGISNLDLTLGQMSVWHIFQSGFSNFSDPFLRMNVILLIIYVIYIYEKESWIQLCFIPVLLLFSQSPTPDLPVILFSLIILHEIFIDNRRIYLLFAFSVFVFTIKPTMIWLPIVSFGYSLFIIRSNSKSFILGAIIICLFFFKNIWTFGYLVFPISIGDLGIPWKPNQAILKTSSQFAILKTFDMQYTYQEIQTFSWQDYIKNWLFLPGIKSVINITFIITLFLFILYSFIKKKKIITLICVSLLIKSILILFFSAQYRFFIDVFFIIFFIVFNDLLNKKRSLIICYSLSIFFIFFLTFPKLIQQLLPSFMLSNFMGKFEKKQIIKPSTYEYNKFDFFKIGNLKFNISNNYSYNFDTPLPSISPSYVIEDVKAGIFPQLIDEKDIKKGIIWKHLDATEKKEAKKIIYFIEKTYQ
ncbi:LIC_10190 family membrane protein [Chryseobacterium nematophagum]|uniref:LIC_10190 family membrane protein n=1 Tax=Chryseobacterium nematophagum TaxID=2305228 RepID=UPI0026B3E2D5